MLVVVVVLALFIAGVLLRGLVGALLVGVPAVLAGALLATRWTVLDSRIRLFRAAVVLACIAVAVSLVARG